MNALFLRPTSLSSSNALASCEGRVKTTSVFVFVMAALTALTLSPANAQCPEGTPLQNYTGAGSVACPCFVVGEIAGVVLDAPPADYPIEILRVGVGWGSQFGGAGQSLEQGLHIYAAGLPNPGAPIFTLPGPVLTDGAINSFNLDPLPDIIINSGPFAVGLEFANQSAGNIFAPSVVHDGNGCQPGKNMVMAIPGGWADACSLGVTGDWVFFVAYRPVNCTPTGIEEGIITNARDALLMQPYPNPFQASTEIEFFLPVTSQITVAVYDVTGKEVATLTDGVYNAGVGRVAWDGRGPNDARMPSGVYFVRLTTPKSTSVRKVLITK